MTPVILTMIAFVLFLGSIYVIARAWTQKDPDAEIVLIGYAVITIAAVLAFMATKSDPLEPHLHEAVVILFFTCSLAMILRFGPYRPKSTKP